MASLRKLQNSPYWIACFTLPDGRRTQRSTKTSDLKEAQRIANKFEDASDEAKKGRLSEAQARRVISDIYQITCNEVLPSSSAKDYFDRWLKRIETQKVLTTYERYRRGIKQFTDFLGAKANQDISHINSRLISSARDHYAQTLSPVSADYIVKVVRAALNSAKREGLVDVNEASRVELLQKPGNSRRRAFTMDEIKQILKVANAEWRGIILFALYTGQRLGDIVSLCWNNIHLDVEEIRFVAAKTKKNRAIPIPSPLLRYIREELPASDDPTAPLFPEAYDRKTRSVWGGSLSNVFYNILVDAGLAKKRSTDKQLNGRSTARNMNELSFHCFRHTTTSLLKASGVSDAIAREFIGHDSAAVSRIYTHIDTSSMRKAVAKLPDLVG